MKKFIVSFEVYIGGHHRETESVVVEAGNKKMAYTRGLAEMSKMKEYADKFKQIISVEEAV